MENSPYTDARSTSSRRLGSRAIATSASCCSRPSSAREEDAQRHVNALGARVRLVKGAYKEPTAVAYQEKADVDAAFVRMMKTLLTAGTYPAIATHDPAMIEATRAFAAEQGHREGHVRVPDAVRHPPRPAGLARGRRLPRARLRAVRQQWFPYFMRRLGERPANVGFVLKGIFGER